MTSPVLDSQLRPAGRLGLHVIRAAPRNLADTDRSLSQILKYGMPQRGLAAEVNAWRRRNFPRLFKGAWKLAAARKLGLCNITGALGLKVIRPNGLILDYGLASLRVVTTVGVGYIVDAFQNSVELEDMKYHGIGLGTTGAAVGDTDIETELTTQYQTDNTRATGTTAENGANVYQTVATNTVDATAAITEHGLLSSATVGSGVLFDRHTFTVINLASGDSLQSTYEATFSAGG